MSQHIARGKMDIGGVGCELREFYRVWGRRSTPLADLFSMAGGTEFLGGHRCLSGSGSTPGQAGDLEFSGGDSGIQFGSGHEVRCGCEYCSGSGEEVNPPTPPLGSAPRPEIPAGRHRNTPARDGEPSTVGCRGGWGCGRSAPHRRAPA